MRHCPSHSNQHALGSTEIAKYPLLPDRRSETIAVPNTSSSCRRQYRRLGAPTISSIPDGETLSQIAWTGRGSSLTRFVQIDHAILSCPSRSPPSFIISTAFPPSDSLRTFFSSSSNASTSSPAHLTTNSPINRSASPACLVNA